MLIKTNDTIFRVLDSDNNNVLIINCMKDVMPVWRELDSLLPYKEVDEQELFAATKFTPIPLSDLDPEAVAVIQKKFSLIAPILDVIGDAAERSKKIRNIAKLNEISKQSVRDYLTRYLIYQDRSALAPKRDIRKKNLTEDQKNMRWALNKYYYTQDKNSLKTAYRLMLEAKYCDDDGILKEDYPPFHKFHYFYSITKKQQNYLISRNGKTNYQRNDRPLLGDGVQEYARSIGMGMLDCTICDIYLINEENNLVGRPILTACVDAYSGLCNGFALSWEGGVYNLKKLLLNIVSDKVKFCRGIGINIKKEQWDSVALPATFVTDMGSEYTSEAFEQITELGVKITILPAYRPELKGVVEKFFDLVQNSFKHVLMGKGVIRADFQERGVHDYRKDACLTLNDFEKVIASCILYYNNSRLLENFPMTEDMMYAGVKPYASSIWEWGKKQQGANMIDVSAETLMKVMLPRTIGKFRRDGLIVNKLRYKNKDLMEMYLKKEEVTVAYDPDDVTYVWMIKKGKYIQFEIIESRFEGKPLDEVKSVKENYREMIKKEEKENLQAQIDLGRFIETIAKNASSRTNINTKNIRETRRKEIEKTHIDFMNWSDEDE